MADFDSSSPPPKRVKRASALQGTSPTSLPPELVFSILTFCPIRTILQFRLSSRLHNEIFWSYSVSGASEHTPPSICVCRALILMRRAMDSALDIETKKTSGVLSSVVDSAFSSSSSATAAASDGVGTEGGGSPWESAQRHFRQLQSDRTQCGQQLTDAIVNRLCNQSKHFKQSLDAKRTKLACIRRLIKWIKSDCALCELDASLQLRMVEFARDCVEMKSLSKTRMDFWEDTEMSYVLCGGLLVSASQHTEEGENYSLDVYVTQLHSQQSESQSQSQQLFFVSDRDSTCVNSELLDSIMTRFFETPESGLEILSQGAVLAFLLKALPGEVYLPAESGDLVGYCEGEIEEWG